MSSFTLFAYVDPVSGVILLQLFLGGCIGLMAGFRHRIWRAVTRPFAKAPAEEPTVEIPTTPATVRPVKPAEPVLSRTVHTELTAPKEEQEVRKAA